MSSRIQSAVEELRLAIAECAGEGIVSANVFINAYESEITLASRTPEQLQSAGISMKNLAGNFIRNRKLTTEG